jgi:LPS export ABC transporter protein LptC
MKTAARAKFLIVFSIACLIAASVLFLIEKPGLKRPPAPTKEVKMDQAEISIDGFRFSNTDKEKGNWDLTARKADVRKDTGIASLKDLQAIFNGIDGTVLTLKADSGTFDTNSKDVKLFGENKDIRITSSSGYEMFAKNLRWDNEKKELSTDDFVKLSGRNIKIEGRGLVARSDLQEVKINNGVKTVFTQTR